MITEKLYRYTMSSATKLRVMMPYGEQAARLGWKIKRAKVGWPR